MLGTHTTCCDDGILACKVVEEHLVYFSKLYAGLTVGVYCLMPRLADIALS